MSEKEKPRSGRSQRQPAAGARAERGAAPEAIEVLAGLTKDGEPSVRAAAARALGEVVETWDRRALALFQALCADPEPDVRAGAAEGLGFYGELSDVRDPRRVESLRLLASLAKDPDAAVRAQVAEALGWVGRPGKG